jgi:hypothetical protein
LIPPPVSPVSLVVGLELVTSVDEPFVTEPSVVPAIVGSSVEVDWDVVDPPVVSSEVAAV